jgi:hypothetical protein
MFTLTARKILMIVINDECVKNLNPSIGMSLIKVLRSQYAGLSTT